MKKELTWNYWGQWRDVALFNSPWLSFIETDTAQSLGVEKKMIGNSIVLDGHMFCLSADQEYIDGRVSKSLQGKDNFIRKMLKVCDRQTKVLKRLENKNNLPRFIEEMGEVIACSMFVHFVDKSLEPALHALCQKYNIAFSDVLAHIHPKNKTLLMEYQSGLKNLTRKNAKKFVDSYQWVGLHGFRGNPLTVQQALHDKKQQQKVKHENLRSIKLTRELQKIIAIGSQLAFNRSNLVEVVTKVGLSYWPALKKLGAEHGLSFQDVVNCSHVELLATLSGNPFPKHLKKRKKRFGITYINRRWKVLVGAGLNRTLRKNNLTSTFAHAAEVRGQVAFPGVVRGRAFIAISAEEASTLTRGDILIAPETTPDYIVAMGKAAAFVTNQGGITSHAAIVARELKKPCVIGTKNATQVFKDGDLVEVDATKGIVKKIHE